MVCNDDTIKNNETIVFYVDYLFTQLPSLKHTRKKYFFLSQGNCI